MRKMMFFGLSLLVVLQGCGKRKEQVHEKDVKSSEDKKLSFNYQDGTQDVPVYTVENNNLLDDDGMTEFAFVDDNDSFDENEENNPQTVIAQAENLDKSSEVASMSTDELDKAIRELDASLAELDVREDELLTLNDREDVRTEELASDFEAVHFSFNKDNIRPDQAPVVKKDCELAKKAADSGKTIVVKGHTCQIGSASYNLALSQRRAETVKKEMISNGVNSSKVKTLGMGYESPLVWSDKADRLERIKELAPNRRAEVELN